MRVLLLLLHVLLLRLLVLCVSCISTSSSREDDNDNGGSSNKNKQESKIYQFRGLATSLESDIPSCAVGQIRRFLLEEDEARGKVNSCTYFFTMLVDERLWQSYFQEVTLESITALFGSYGCQELGNTAVSWACIEARRGQAKQIENILKELQAISTLCLTQTFDIDKNVSLQLQGGTGMTEQIVTENFDGAIVKEFDFPSNTFYESVCIDASGIYVELSYQATCYIYSMHKHEYLDLEVSEYVRMEHLFVDDHQRCFASSCTRADRNGLVQEFAIKPTETLIERFGPLEGVVNKRTFHSFCLGEETEPSAPTDDDNLCLSDTLSMADISELDMVERAVRPEVGYDKFLGFIVIKREKTVSFPGLYNEVQAYKAVCQSNGGFYNTLGETDIVCSKVEREATAGNVYEVEDFGACLAVSCDGEIEKTRAAIAAMFRRRLVGSGDLENAEDMECVISGAFHVLSMAVATVVLALVPALEQFLS